MNFDQPEKNNQEETMKNVDFKRRAEKLNGLVGELSGINELGDDFVSVQARARAETASVLLQEIPEIDSEEGLGFKRKVLEEMERGIGSFKPKNENDFRIKEDIQEMIKELKEAI